MKDRDPKAMIFEKNRLETFSKWIYKNETAVKCTPQKMAKAGFYVVSENEPGTVKCFVCMKTLDGWERNDDPFEEHKKHAAQCPFITLNKEEDDITVEELLSLCERMDTNLLEQHLQDHLKKFQELQDNFTNQLKKAERKNKVSGRNQF